MLQKYIKQVIISLISEFDYYFAENGFLRKSNSLTCIRKLDGVTTKCRNSILLKPFISSRCISTYISSYADLYSFSEWYY